MHKDFFTSFRLQNFNSSTLFSQTTFIYMKYECLQASVTKMFAIPGNRYKRSFKENTEEKADKKVEEN